jgi:phosphoribosylglycinamide formyltransferase-1
MSENRGLAILLSGRGSNFAAIHDAISKGLLRAEIRCVVSNREDAGGLARARSLGLAALCLPSLGRDRAAYDRLLVEKLEPYAPRLVCLAGFMRILGPELLRRYAGRVLNIHPALLPAFPGLYAQRQALEYGVKVSGCTVHLVDEGVDTGPILLQRAVEVRGDDTEECLSERILAEEHDLYWRAIALVLDGRVRLEGRRAGTV